MSDARSSRDTTATNEQLLEEYYVDAEIQGLTEETLQTYRSNLEYFVDWLDCDLQSVGKSELRHFLQHLKTEKTGRRGEGLAPSTLSGYVSAINACFEFLEYEDYIEDNPVPQFRDRYMSGTGTGADTTTSERQLISVEEMAGLVQSILNVRNRALVVTLAKTGIRRNELVELNVDDVNWDEQSVTLKPTPKRSNRVVFFDSECGRVLRRWLDARSNDEDVTTDALFTNQSGNRLGRNGVYSAVTTSAEKVGLHDPDSDSLDERFTPHCCRHWFTTHLRKSGMKREFIKELRGDTRGDAIDIYDHIEQDELRQAYLAHIPTLGV